MNEYINEQVIVTESSAELKQLSKTALRGLWIKATIGYFIYYAFVTLIPKALTDYFPWGTYTFTEQTTEFTFSVSPLLYFYRLLLVGPFVVGFNKYILRIIRRRETDYKLLFSGFEKFIKSFLLQLFVGLLTTLWTLPFLIPSTILLGSAPTLSGLFSIIAMGIGIWAYLRYVMAPYFMADDWNLSPMDCIKISAAKMKGNKGQLVYLLITFLGWMFVSILPGALLLGMFPTVGFVGGFILDLILNIPSFFVMIYIYVTEGFFYELLSGRLRKAEPNPIPPTYY